MQLKTKYMGEAARLPGRQTKTFEFLMFCFKILLRTNIREWIRRFFRSYFERPILIDHVRKTPRNRHSEFAFRQPVGCDASHIKSTYLDTDDCCRVLMIGMSTL